MENLTLAFTGPRAQKLCGWHRKAYEPFIDDLSERLYEYYKIGYKKYISGAATGMDQCAFKAVHKMKEKFNLKDVENVVYVPFNGHINSIYVQIPNSWDDTVDDVFSKEEYVDMLDKADDFITLHPTPKFSPQATRFLLDRNVQMVKDSNLVLALFNGNDWNKGFSKGGTQDAMRKAIKYKKALHQILYETNFDTYLRIKDIKVIQ